MNKSIIHSNQFIIASINCNDVWHRVSGYIYDSYSEAKKDAKYMAENTPSKKYVVLAIAAVAEYQASPVKVTYELEL